MSILNASPVAIVLDAETRSRLTQLSEGRSVPVHELFLAAIREYLDREEKRDELLEASIEAWADFQKTALHVTAEEADAWLAKLEAGIDADPPEPHV